MPQINRPIMADPHFSKVKEFVTDLDYYIHSEDPDEGLLIISDEDNGIQNLVLDCEDPILIIEQFLFELKEPSVKNLTHLLQKNREIIHGALVLDDSGRKVIFRDTLQLENLDLNEVEGTLNALALLMTEFFDELLAMARGEPSASQ